MIWPSAATCGDNSSANEIKLKMSLTVPTFVYLAAGGIITLTRRHSFSHPMSLTEGLSWSVSVCCTETVFATKRK